MRLSLKTWTYWNPIGTYTFICFQIEQDLLQLCLLFYSMSCIHQTYICVCVCVEIGKLGIEKERSQLMMLYSNFLQNSWLFVHLYMVPPQPFKTCTELKISKTEEKWMQSYNYIYYKTDFNLLTATILLHVKELFLFCCIFSWVWQDRRNRLYQILSSLNHSQWCDGHWVLKDPQNLHSCKEEQA